MATRKQIGWTVPGFGLPLRWPEMQSVRWQPLFQPDENTVLLSVLDGSENPNFCYTVRERTMMKLIGRLTDLPDWHRHIFDPEWTSRWAAEALSIERDVTANMAAWCIEEVKYYVRDYVQSQLVPALDGGVIKSDTCLSPLLRTGLQKAMAEIRRDHRVEPCGRVLRHIVDSYYHPFVFEKTRTLRRGQLNLANCVGSIGKGEPVGMPSEGECIQSDPAKYPNDMAWSRHFQWLPFDVKFDARSKGYPRIASYINNVHPLERQSFYAMMEEFIDYSLPLFERSLLELKAPGHQNQRFHVLVLGREPTITKGPGRFRPPEQRATKQWLDDQGRFHGWLGVDLRKEFWNVGVQMVLHVRQILLTPASPKYEGEDYHVQGQMNERICATALYAVSNRNISTPMVAFRRRVNAEEAMVAKDYIESPPFAPELYGSKDGDPVIQHIGDVSLPEGRLVTSPHIFQTRLLPFELSDKAKNGHLTILELHLVDPNRRIMSTAMVPPQQRDWWAKEVRLKCTRFWKLPNEIWDRIVSMVDDYPPSAGEAQVVRDAFVRERGDFQKKHTQAMMDYLQWDLDPDGEWVKV